MAIMSAESTRISDEDRSIVLVTVSEELRSRATGAYLGETEESGYEFTCQACGALSTMLSEEDARAELREHVCPDLPPCAGEWEGA